MTEQTGGLSRIQALFGAIRALLRDALRTSAELFKIIIPISIITRFLQQWGVVDQLGVLLAPVMELVGLPGPIGLVWATTLVTNLYGGMVVFASIAPALELTVAQADHDDAGRPRPAGGTAHCSEGRNPFPRHGDHPDRRGAAARLVTAS